MIILHVSTRLIIGGSQENTLLSCEGQARAGHRVHLAFGPIYGPEGSMLPRVQRFNRDNPTAPITTHELPSLVRHIAPLKDLAALRQLRSLVRAVKPDVVHTHSSKAGVLGRAAAWAERTPAVVHTIHGPPFMPVEGSPLRRARTRAQNHLYTLAERWAARRCHAIVAVADAMTDQFRARRIGAPAQFSTIRSGMELAPFLEPMTTEQRAERRAALGIPDDALVVGTVARLAQHKGHDDLIDALADRLRDDPDVYLLWVGDGWWRERLETRLADAGVRNKVVITGMVPAHDVPGLVKPMDVLAHPSAREGLPRTVPQALLSGVAVVAYDADGTREACVDGETGVLVPVGDVAALRRGVLGLLDDASLRARLAEEGRRRCVEMFDADTMVRRLVALYAGLVGSGAGRGVVGVGPAADRARAGARSERA